MTTNTAPTLSLVASTPEEVTFGKRGTRRHAGSEDAYVTRNGTHGNVVLCLRKGMINEMFPDEEKFDYTRGLHPNEAWLRVTPNKMGVKMVGALYFSLSSIIPRERVERKERHTVELFKREDALYVRLPWELIK